MRKIAMFLSAILVAVMLNLSMTTPANAAVCGTGVWVSSATDSRGIEYDDELATDWVGIKTQVRVQYCNGGMKIATHVRTVFNPEYNTLYCKGFNGFESNPTQIGTHNPSPKFLACWNNHANPKTLIWDIPNQTLWSSSDRSIEQSVKFNLKRQYDKTLYGIARKTV